MKSTYVERRGDSGRQSHFPICTRDASPLARFSYISLRCSKVKQTYSELLGGHWPTVNHCKEGKTHRSCPQKCPRTVIVRAVVGRLNLASNYYHSPKFFGIDMLSVRTAMYMSSFKVI